MPTVTVTVTGLPGSGKTTIAKLIRDLLVATDLSVGQRLDVTYDGDDGRHPEAAHDPQQFAGLLTRGLTVAIVEHHTEPPQPPTSQPPVAHDVTAALVSLCEVMLIDVDNLRHAACDTAPEERAINRTLADYIEVLANADNSVRDVLRLIERVCDAQHVYKVHGYFRDENGKGPRTYIDTVIVRAHNVTEAGSIACDRLWDAARLSGVDVAWAFDAAEHQLDPYDGSDGTSMRPE